MLLLSRFSHVQLGVTLWTVAHQAPLSMGSYRQEYWSGVPCPPPGDLLDPGNEPRSPALQADSLPLSYQGNPFSSSVQFSRSVVSNCLQPMNHSTPGLPIHHQLLEFTQAHVHRVSDAIQSSHSLSSPSPPAPNPSQHQSLFQWVNSFHEVAKVLELQLQHHSFQRKPRTDLL